MGNFDLDRRGGPERTFARAPFMTTQPDRLAGGLHA